MRNREIILVVVNNSLGEVHFILPYLIKTREECGLDIYFYFVNSKIYDKTVNDTFFYDQISQNASILKPSEIFSFLSKKRKRVSLILKDTTPVSSSNIVVKIRHCCPYAKLIFFPHAYALLGYKEQGRNENYVYKKEDEVADYVLYGHSFDKPWLRQRFPEQKLVFSGALGYTSWWRAYVSSYVEANLKNPATTDGKSMVVLFTIRDVHRIYLNAENFEYLFRTALKVLFDSTNHFVIIKPHPRQNINSLESFLSGYDSNRYTIQYHNTFVLACLADINLSFWSSAVTDCLAMGVPALEFHKFHVPFSQTVESEGGLESFYTHLGLAEKVTSGEELEGLLKLNEQGLSKMLRKQQKTFYKIFPDDQVGFNNFKALINREERSGYTMNRSAKSLFYFFLKSIYRKVKPV